MSYFLIRNGDKQDESISGIYVIDSHQYFYYFSIQSECVMDKFVGTNLVPDIFYRKLVPTSNFKYQKQANLYSTIIGSMIACINRIMAIPMNCENDK